MATFKEGLTLLAEVAEIFLKSFFGGAIVTCGIIVATYYICTIFWGIKF